MTSIDNQIKQQGTPRGIGSNPGLLIDSYEMKGKDGYVVYDDAFDTRAEIGFIGGEAIRADGPGKKIIETPWLSAGTIRDNMILFLSYETSVLGSATSIVSGTPILEGRIYKRNPKTKEIEKSIDIGYRSKTATQKNPGTPNMQSQANSFATRFLNFTPQHEYKIELYTTTKIEDNQSVIIDYLYLEYVANQSWTEPRSVGFNGAEAADVGGIPGVPVLEAFPVAISMNANGDGSATCDGYTETSYLTSYQDYNYFFGTFNTIYGAFYTPTQQNGADAWGISAAASPHPAGGYNITISLNSAFGAGTLYGTALLVGHKAADQI